MAVKRKDWSESEWPPMADKEPRIRVPTTSSKSETTDSFFQRLLSRSSTFARKKAPNRIKYGQSIETLDSIVIIPSPNTHPLLTRPFPREESLGRMDLMGGISDSRRRRTTGLSSLNDRNFSKWELTSTPKKNVTTCTDGKPSKPSTAGCTPEWDLYVRCYSEGRFNLSNPPEPPSHKPPFQYFPAPIPTNEDIRLKALKSYNLPMTENAVEKCQRLVTLAKKVFQVEMGTISMIDEQNEIFKIDGMIKRPFIKRHLSIGAHVLLSTEPVVILDTAKDWRFKKNPIVNESLHIRFYCGAPIVTSNSEVLGVFAMFDTEPRESFTMANRRKLMDFARLAMVEFEFLLEESDSSRKHRAVKGSNTHIQLPTSRGNLSTTALLSTEERESVRARLFQNIEHDAETVKRKGTPLTASRPIDIKRKALSTASPVARRKHETSVVGSVPNDCRSPYLSMSVRGHSSTLLTIGHPSSSTVWMNAPTRPTSASSATKVEGQLQKHILSVNSGNEINLGHSSRNLPNSSRYLLDKNYADANFAISLIARSLSFDLVYLLRVCPIRSDTVDSELADNGLHTQVLASHGMPQPEPLFDGSLHLRALWSDGGLVYSNQNKASKDQGCGYQLGILLPLHREDGAFESREDTNGGTDTTATLAVSGIITPSTHSRGGIVLCAFTRTTLKSSTFSPEEVRLFREFAGALRDILFSYDSQSLRNQ